MRNLILFFAMILSLPLVSQIPVNTPFELNSNNTVITRLVQAELADTATMAFKAKGELVWFEDVQEHWYWDGGKWSAGFFGPSGIYGGSGLVPDGTLINVQTDGVTSLRPSRPIFVGRGPAAGISVVRSPSFRTDTLVPPTFLQSWGYFSAGWNGTNYTEPNNIGIRFVADSNWVTSSPTSLWIESQAPKLRLHSSKESITFNADGANGWQNGRDSAAFYFQSADLTNETKTFNTFWVSKNVNIAGLKSNGQLKLNNYGNNTFSGSVATYAAFDADGNLIETTVADGNGIITALPEAPVNIDAAGNNLSITNAGTITLGDSSGTYTLTQLANYPRLTATATLDFPSIAANMAESLTVTVTGAAVGDVVNISQPGGVNDFLIYSAHVSAPNTVNIKVNNVGGSAIDPASAVFNVMVWKYPTP